MSTNKGINSLQLRQHIKGQALSNKPQGNLHYSLTRILTAAKNSN